MTPDRLVIGVMSGTSIDAIDAALVRIEGRGLEMKATVVWVASRPLGSLAPKLRALAEQQPMTAGEIADLSLRFARAHLEPIRLAMQDERVDLIAVHGQTVFHKPPLSWQLLNPAPIAYELGIPVVYDLRAADLALGGQGAPITPIADFILFRDQNESRTVVNLGGFCNVTRIPAGQRSADLNSWLAMVLGRDVCACNQLLDALARDLLGKPFDRGGKAAAKGKVVNELLRSLQRRLASQNKMRRSLGTEDVLADWIKDYGSAPRAEDVLRTACTAIAITIVSGPNCDRLILAGGGAKNQTLDIEIANWSKAEVSLSNSFGIPADFREAVEMAILGALCQDRVPITLSQVTGVVNAPVAGIWVMP